jgi:arginine decarboxylase
LEVWSTKKSAELYGIESWGAGYFKVNDKGHVEVTPKGPDGGGIDLMDLVRDLQERGLRAPLLIRFPDIVNSRINILHNAFAQAFETQGYKGKYRGVFPIKVNQQRYLVEEIAKYGRNCNLGLEAGSKPELLVALAVMDNPEALIICNGFKDSEYIETALLAQKLGRNTLIVIDRYDELQKVIASSKALNLRPRIGFRAKLETKGAGKWVESSGAKSKFGLTTPEMIKGIQILEAEGMLGSLELLHFHIGSQITTLRAIKDSLIEACRVYVELASMGAGLRFLDVGGGLGVDYDGSQTNWENSVNYSVNEYAAHVVAQIAAVCDDRGIAHPDIVTEAGRALVAHHSALVFDVVGTNCIRGNELPKEEIEAEDQESIVELYRLFQALSAKNIQESILDAFKVRDDGMSLFNLGYMSLKQRALMEQLFWAYCTKALSVSEAMSRPPEEMADLKKFLCDSYYCNFSLFQSAPDTWAVKQLFPIMPIHRLKETPTRQGHLLDLTCDSDGKIDKFIDIKDVKESLSLHTVHENEPYFIGMFLVGAYQEILGDFHNLFGDTDAVHVSLSPTGYQIDHVVEGDTVQEVLSYVQYDRPSLVRQIRNAVEAALSNKTISLEESRLLLRYYEDGLNGYTYLDTPTADADLSAVDALRKIGQRQAVVGTVPTQEVVANANGQTLATQDKL